jgi:branched-chain amino acid transport system ATP-binding protein
MMEQPMETPLLATHKVTKSFDGLLAVNAITFELYDKTAAGIIGPNGAGKTTFFNLLTGLHLPTAGRVYYQGEEITGTLAYKRVNLGLARTFQLVSVFDSMTVLENMMLARIRLGRNYQSKMRFFFKYAHHRELVDECLRALDTMGIANKAETPTSDLSYGEKRELEIAIALSLNPRVLLLDEPFAGLSPVDITHISEVIGGLRGRFAIAIVEHKISAIMGLVEKLYVINEGRLICSGVPGEVICDPQVRECYWGNEEVACY